MSFFRANLIGLKADRDKKEIGTFSRSLYYCSIFTEYILLSFVKILNLARPCISSREQQLAEIADT